MIGFIKWLYSQYQVYQIEKSLPKKNDDEFLKHFHDFFRYGLHRKRVFSDSKPYILYDKKVGGLMCDFAIIKNKK